MPGGASGGILPAKMADIPLDFGTLEPHGCFVGSHAVVILSDKDDMKAVALNLMKFFEDESCGQCTPCRAGTEKAVKLMAQDVYKRQTKFEAMDLFNKHDIPCGPILSMKEIADDESLRTTGTVVEVDHPTRGKYLTVGNPIKLSDSPADVRRSPLLGEHTEEILSKVLGYSASQIGEIKTSGAITAPDKSKAAA